MNDTTYPDMVDERFKRHSAGAEQIQFGKEWWLRPDKDKIEYLIKLASSLNHAAVQIQKERDELNKLLFSKEEQLTESTVVRDQDRQMIQKQLLRENKAKEELLQENQSLRAEIKRLENGNIN